MSGVPDINWAQECDDAIDALASATIEEAHAIALIYPNHTVLAALIRRLNEVEETGPGGSPDAADVDLADAGGYYTATDVEAAFQEIANASLELVLDGGGDVVPTGVIGDLEVPFDCTIVSARLFADQSGSIVVDIWADSYSNFPPNNGDSITAAAPPTLSSSAKSEDTTLTGWTKTLTKGDVLRFNVDSAATVERVTLALGVTRR